MNYNLPKGKSYEFINASHKVVWFNPVIQEELGRDKVGRISTKFQTDWELFNQLFLFHLRPQRNTFGRVEERGNEDVRRAERMRRDRERRGDREKEEDGGRCKTEG